METAMKYLPKFVTTSHANDSNALHNMADRLADKNCEDVAHFPKLEDLCVKFIRVNVNYWKPENFLGEISCLF